MNNLFKKLLSCFLILTFVFTSVPFAAFADDTTGQSATAEKSQTMMADVESSNFIFRDAENFGYKRHSEPYKIQTANSAASYSNSNYFTNIDDAGKYVKKCLLSKDSSITVCGNFSLYGWDLVDAILEAAFVHTGVPTEGDYLKWNLVRWREGYSQHGSVTYITYEPVLTNTLAQENEITAKVNQLVKEFSKESNDYNKVLAVHNWMLDNITYVSDAKYNENYHHLTHSAITGETVCQGYAALFYRLALELGINCRLIGSIPEEWHCWNIVQLGNKYYNLDVTWNDNWYEVVGYYNYFLTGSNSFDLDHTRDTEYCTAAFNKQYPTSTTDFDPSTYLPSPKLTVTTTTAGNPKLTWTTLKNVSKYQIYRSKTGKAGSYGLVKTVTDGTTWTDTNITKGQKYYYKVRAVYTNGLNSEYSAVKTITAKLAAPTNLKATNVASSGKIKLTWTKVTGATKYEIWRSKTGKDGSYGKIYTTSNTSYTNTNAEAGTKYYYKIKAVNGNSAAASGFSAVKSLRCDLPQVKNVTVKNVAASGKPMLKWDAVDSAVKYEIYRSTTGKDGSFTFLVSTTATSQVNANAVAGKKYFYKVKAVHSNSDANGAFSAATESIICDLANPKVKISLNAKGKPMLKWDAMDGVKNYEIWRSTTGKAGSFTKIYTVAGTAKSYTNSNATKGVTYYYKVKAVHSNANATSAFSTVVTIKSK